MEVYWISHTIRDKTTPKGDYAKRYSALTTGLNKVSDGWWPEPTSFVAFGSNADLSEIVSIVKGAIDVSCDVVVIGKPHFKSMTVVGKVEHMDALVSIVEFAKKA